MDELPDYVVRDINDGDAFLTDDKDDVKKIIRGRLMPYLMNLDESYIQQEVDGWVEAICSKDNGYMYYSDLDLTLIKFIPTYVNMTIQHLLDETVVTIRRLIDESKRDINDK